MSDAEIQQAILDAERYAAADSTYRTGMEVMNEARKLIASVEQGIKNAGKQLDKAEKKQIKADIAALNKLLMKAKPEKMTEIDISNIRSAMSQLESSSANLPGMNKE